MAKIDYEFDQGNGEQKRTGIYLRLAAIFLVVAALTAGIIWFLIPKSEEDGDGKKSPEQPEAVQPQPEQPEQLPEDGEKTPKPEKRPAESVLPKPPEQVTELPPAPETEVPKTVVEPLDPEIPATLLPVKGKPWVGDPAVDRPEIPAAVIPSSVRPALDAEFNRVEQALEKKNYASAAGIARSILTSPGVVPYSTEWRQAAGLLTEASLAAFSARTPQEKLTVTYTAKPGDSFSRIAAQHHTTIEAIKHYNRIAENDNNLRVSQRLLIYPGPWKVVVRKGPRILELYNRGVLYAVFDVGLGRLGKTPAAEFVVSAKLRNPDWYSPEGKVVRYGDPDNPLGNRFLKLAPTGSPDRPLLGYGIHGTQDDSDITRSLSNGCVRMRNADVETVYIIVPGRTPVEIVE